MEVFWRHTHIYSTLKTTEVVSNRASAGVHGLGDSYPKKASDSPAGRYRLSSSVVVQKVKGSKAL